MQTPGHYLTKSDYKYCMACFVNWTAAPSATLSSVPGIPVPQRGDGRSWNGMERNGLDRKGAEKGKGRQTTDKEAS